MDELCFTIPLAPVTKKNSSRIIHHGGRSYIVPSSAYEAYERDAGYFLPRLPQPISGPCEVVCLFFVPARRRVDLTNLLEAIDDVLVKCGVLADDNCTVIVSHDGSRVRYDKARPRTEIIIRPTDEEVWA